MITLKELNLGFSIDVGAPFPIILTSENRTFLLFYPNKYDLEKISFPMPRNASEDKRVVLFEFANCLRMYNGDPDEESIGYHRYDNIGIESHSYYEVLDSEWIMEIEKTIAKPLVEVKPLQHLVFCFHDNLMEFVSRGYEYEILEMTMQNAIEMVSKRLIN